MPARIQTTGSVTVASLTGEIDHHSAAPMRAAIDTACADNASRTLVLDFGGVTFMDSSGVGLVMGRFKLMQTLGGELILSNLPAPIRKVMRMAGLDRLAVIDQKNGRSRFFTETEKSAENKSEDSVSNENLSDSMDSNASPVPAFSEKEETPVSMPKEDHHEKHE